MLLFRSTSRCASLGLFAVALLAVPALAREKPGMPDLGQEEQTCLPTATANLIVYFGQHGYPKLIVKGDDEADGYIHTVHALMTATNATYQLGTRTDAITYGIEKYIREAGYSADVEYRGIDWSLARYPEIVKDVDGDLYKKSYKTPAAFTPDWLQDNNDPQKAFLLLLAYVKYDRNGNSFSDAIHAGHAVTLVNAEPDMILIHDPAHYEDEPGRKILTPEVLTGGTFQLPGYPAPVAGLMLLSGTLMDTPEDSEILLTGAVCVTMHPDNDDTSIVKGTAGSPNNTVAGASGQPADATKTPAGSAAKSQSQSWAMWLFDMFFKK